MRSFFSRWKDKLDQDYGGRYFAVVLKEVLLEDPRILKLLFPGLNSSYVKSSEMIIEYPLTIKSGQKSKRRADLAVLNENEVVALLEVKYEDEKSKENPEQLQDYFNFINQGINSSGQPFGYNSVRPNQKLDTIQQREKAAKKPETSNKP